MSHSSLSTPIATSLRDRHHVHWSRDHYPTLFTSLADKFFDNPTDELLIILYGALVAFLAIALMWWSDDRYETTYGMSGQVTTITLMNSGRSLTGEQQETAARNLRTFLSENDVSMIKVPESHGSPSLIVFDPGHKIGWTESLGAASSIEDPVPGVYTIKGSYSDRTWASSGETVLAPEGLDVLGSIAVPDLTPSNSNLQFVEVPGVEPLGTGKMYLGTTNPDTVAHIVELVEAQGPHLQSINQQEPLPLSLAYNAPVAIATVFTSLGLTCVIASLVLKLPERRDEIRLRALVGATRSELVRDHASRELIPNLAGTAIGSGVALMTTSLIATSAPGSREFTILTLGALIGGIVMWVIRQATFALILSSHLKRASS